MRADYLRVTAPQSKLGVEYRGILEAYDQGGLPYERGMTRLGYGRWLSEQGRGEEAAAMVRGTLELARRHRMTILEIDALELMGEETDKRRASAGYEGPKRP